MKVDAEKLHVALYNTLLFTPGKGDVKKSPSGGLVWLCASATHLDLVGMDGYVAVMNSLELSVRVPKEDQGSWYITGDTGRQLERELRNTTGDYNLLDDATEAADDDYWAGVLEILSLVNFEERTTSPQPAIAPDRLSKFSLLQPRDEYPIALKFGFDSETTQEIIAFRHGPNTSGIIAPLEHERLVKIYGDRISEVLW